MLRPSPLIVFLGSHRDIFPLILFCLHDKRNGSPKVQEILKGAFAIFATKSEISADEKNNLTKLVKYVCLLHLHEESLESLDLLVVARAASLCGFPEAALMLLSLWWDRLNLKGETPGPVAFHEYNGSANLLLVQVGEP